MKQANHTARDARRVYFDGGCPVCRREVAWYREMRGAEQIDWVDLETDEIDPSLDRDALLKRFTVERADGRLADGAAGFIAMWRALPAIRLFGRAADNLVVTWVLERAYRGFLTIRRMWRTVP